MIINKIDRGDARPKEVLNEVYDLFIDLDATEEQIEFPVLYTSGRAGTASAELDTPGENLRPLFDAIVEHVPPPRGNRDAPFQMLVSNLDSSDYLGRIAIGRIFNGQVRINDPIMVLKLDGTAQPTRVTKLFAFEGLKRVEITEAAAGDIVCLAGIEDITIGETIADPEHPVAIPPIAIDEPTVSMVFGVNTSPVSGRDGQYVTSRHLRERLQRELLGNVSLRVEDTDTPEQVKVLGPRRAAAGHPDRDDAPRRLRAAGVAPGDCHQRDRRREDGADRGAGHRRRRGVPGRRDCQHRSAARHDDEDGESRQRPCSSGVPHPGPRADRIPLDVSHRDQGHRHHESSVRRLGAVARSDRVTSDRARWSPIVPASPPPMRSRTFKSAASCSSTPRPRSTKA